MFDEQPNIQNQLSAFIGEIPRPMRRALAAWSIGSTAWATYKRAKSWHEGRLTYTVAVEGNDEMYPHIHNWLLNNIPVDKQRSVIVRSAARRRGAGSATLRRILSSSASWDEDEEEDDRSLLSFYDGSRPQHVNMDGHRIKVTVEKDDKHDRFKSEGAATAAMIQAGETIRFTANSRAGRDAIHRQLNELHDKLHNGPPRIRLYVATKWGEWTRKSGVRNRALETVVLKDGQMDRIVDDMRDFMRSAKRYEELGLPHHRGYMFHGPPGTGKTSIARALASHFDMPLYIMPLSDVESDTNLLQLISSMPPRSILLLEDIDIASAARERHDEDAKGASMSGLLNALDGISTPDGMIVIMTSNHMDRLDDALLRTGRVDMIEKVGYVDQDQLLRLTEYLTGEQLEVAAPKKLTAADVIEVVKPHAFDNEAAKAALLERFSV